MPPYQTANYRLHCWTAVKNIILKKQSFQKGASVTPFMHNLIATTLRHHYGIQHVLKDHMKHQPPAAVRVLISLGVVECLFMNTPSHACLDETVALCNRVKTLRPYKNLVNALLRKVTRSEIAYGPDQYIYNLVPWLRDKLTEAFGDERVDLWMREYLLKAPSLDAVIKEGSLPESHPRFDGLLALPPVSSVEDLPGYKAGNFWIQSAPAFLSTQLWGADVMGKRVLDLCAAPGGKTMSLASQGTHVTAVDICPKRLARVHQNLQRTGLTDQVTVVQSDGLKLTKIGEPFDFVLADVPCSGTGTLQKNPDGLHTKSPSHVAELVILQQKLLVQALYCLKPGGTLLYTTCSLLPEENDGVIEAVLRDHPDLAVRKPFTAVPHLRPESQTDALTLAGSIQFQPHMRFIGDQDDRGTQGFFVARLQRCG